MNRSIVQGMVIAQIANVSTDVHDFVELTIDRGTQGCAMTSTKNARIGERILMRMIERIGRAHAKSTDERTLGTSCTEKRTTAHEK